ncbi:PilZ domain-containing protein [Sphingomonas kaistensis]|uniref:PilZ domain-containing protein n=1 Tax=Sphingomonas kaistensis TaxID=298708 RepID=UPI003CC8C92A
MLERKGWIDRESRSPSWAKVQLADASRTIEAVITNISSGGCRIRADWPLRVGQCLRVRVPGVGSLAAYTRWSRPPYAGLAFIADSEIWEGRTEDPLAPARRMVARAGPAPSSLLEQTEALTRF